MHRSGARAFRSETVWMVRTEGKAMTTETKTLAERIQALEFEHVFTLWPDGTLTEPAGVWAPECYNDPGGDVDLAGAHEWSALTGMTGQDGYSGAVMHASEYVGRGIADYLQELAADEPATFALVVVTDLDADRDAGEDDAIGWAIVQRREAVR